MKDVIQVVESFVIWSVSYLAVAQRSCLCCTVEFANSYFLLYVILLFSTRVDRVKAVGTQGKAQQHLDLLYSHFHGPSSTRENSAVLPFLPMVT